MYKRFGYLKTDAQMHTKNPLVYEDRFIKQKAYISIIWVVYTTFLIYLPIRSI